MGSDGPENKTAGSDLAGFHAAIQVCGTCEGREVVLADLEDLRLCLPGLGPPQTTKCLSACYVGPNCLVRSPANPDAPPRLASKLRTFEATLALALEAAGHLPPGTQLPPLPPLLEPQLWEPPEVAERPQLAELLELEELRELREPALRPALRLALRRARLRSNAMRRLQVGSQAAALEAEALLTEALALEAEQPDPLINRAAQEAGRAPRVQELLMLRAEARGSRAVGRFDDAVADLDAVALEEPRAAEPHLAKARILRRACRWHEALDCARLALTLGEMAPPRPAGLGLQAPVCGWLRRQIAELEDRVAECGTGVFSMGYTPGFSGPEARQAAEDSSNGAGWWKVVRIVGLSPNTCLYFLENSPPAVPHPYPRSLWHVGVFFGSIAREYTPVSTPQEWECGRIQLLVKTYADGAASARFAALLPANTAAELDHQPCWVFLTPPKLTLELPGLTGPDEQHKAASTQPTGAVTHLAMVVGGTGVAPALQALRQVADPDGPFGAFCRATLLYSSRTVADVYMVDELRAAEAQSAGRISVRHTLTDFSAGPLAVSAGFVQAGAASTPSLPVRHNFYSLSPWRPFQPKSGPLRTALGEEAALRGRVSTAMLREALPPPTGGVRIIVCGPPLMWEDVRGALLSLGHAEASLAELQAMTREQC